jgi:putative toxin-antitoxin system antitoxin component (TIGR02293 family)
MATPEARALEILGGASLLEDNFEAALRRLGRSTRREQISSGRGRDRIRTGRGAKRRTRSEPDDTVAAFASKEGPHLEPGELEWTKLVRVGLPAKSTQSLAASLGLSLADLAESLRLPSRTMHRRLAKGEVLTPEESERTVRAARVLAKAQDLLGNENGRGWVLSPSRGLGGESPITLLDTADGFTATMDELGRLEYGVIS